MPETGPDLRWGVEQRLEFIEFRLFWEGGVNRSDITRFFGVSVPQASKDLAQYQEIAPKNAQYDRSEKRYFATERFRPVFIAADAESYLSQLTRTSDGASPGYRSWLTNPPEVGTMPVPHRRVDVDVLRAILSAIREKASLEIRYQSMNDLRHEPVWRRVSPHAFGSDGFRWHVRAFCHIDNKFKDFLLSRCMGVRKIEETDVAHDDDLQWKEFFEVILAPNPKLGESQRKVIAQDYDMPDHKVSIPVRRALLYYFRKRLRLDVADVLDDPHETPVVVTNRAEFDEALAEAMR